MWNLTKEAIEKFNRSNTLPIYESNEEWEISLSDAQEDGIDLKVQLEEELEDVKEELLNILPTRFIPYVENGTLNQRELSTVIRTDYLQWMKDTEIEFENILDAAHQSTQQALTFLPTTVQDVFSESLHDSTIERIERKENTLELYINTDGGFSSKALIHFIFHDITLEETDEPLQVGQWFIYNELQKREDGFAFRVLFDCPDSQWTIEMKRIDALYYYHPELYIFLKEEDNLAELTFKEYIAQLNKDLNYWLITPDVTCRILNFSDNQLELEHGKIEIGQQILKLTVGEKQFTYSITEYNLISFIYTDTYEDPQAHYHEPLPFEELEAAFLSDDLELQVRAWNTMYADPKATADIVNRVLLKLKITDENEMLVAVYVSHFYNEGILNEDVVKMYRSIIEESF